MEFSAIGDIIFFALLAGYIWYKLRMTLGRKDDAVPPPQSFKNNMSKGGQNFAKIAVAKKPSEKPVVQPVPQAQIAPKEPEIKDAAVLEAIKKIQQKDKKFTAGYFLEGANIAFEMVLNAYSKGEEKVLANLLDGPLLKEFKENIAERKANGETLETTLVAIDSSDIVSATVEKNTAEIRVRFVSEQISILKDKTGKVVEGSASQIDRITDEWVFSRDLGSSNPNWAITEI